MRHIVECGSDGATWCMFDPAALPDDFDDQYQKDPVGYCDMLQAEGRFWRTCTGMDAGYVVHVLVDETPPREVLGDQLAGHESFLIPSGTWWVCGWEHASRSVNKRRRWPKVMGDSVPIPAGTYALTLWEGAPNPAEEEDRGCLALFGCGAILIGTVAVVLAVKRGAIDSVWFLPLVVIWVVWFVVLPKLLPRGPARAARRAWPDYVVMLRSPGSPAPASEGT